MVFRLRSLRLLMHPSIIKGPTALKTNRYVHYVPTSDTDVRPTVSTKRYVIADICSVSDIYNGRQCEHRPSLISVSIEWQCNHLISCVYA